MGNTVRWRSLLESRMVRMECVSYSCSSKPKVVFPRCRYKALISHQLPPADNPPTFKFSKNSTHFSVCQYKEG